MTPFYTMIAVERRTGKQEVFTDCATQTMMEVRMETLSRAHPGVYSHFICIGTMPGRAPEIIQFEDKR